MDDGKAAGAAVFLSIPAVFFCPVSKPTAFWPRALRLCAWLRQARALSNSCAAMATADSTENVMITAKQTAIPWIPTMLSCKLLVS
jgi:hypothetical protein